jgi:hypothetical protein
MTRYGGNGSAESVVICVAVSVSLNEITING